MNSTSTTRSAAHEEPTTRFNCWEFFQCGREFGDRKTDELGVCPAAIETERLGPNKGTGYGRYCWRIAGTFCGGRIQGSYLAKMRECHDCPFYQLVAQQEGDALRK